LFESFPWTENWAPLPVEFITGEFSGFLLVMIVSGLASAIGVPGVVIPLTVISAAMLGPLPAAAAVLIGVMAGSQLLFALLRRIRSGRAAARQSTRFAAIQRAFEQRGLFYLIGLRIIGTPHLLVTTASALLPIRSSHFAIATTAGALPAISIAAGVGLLF
jgi:uncharacterized membrane protein YdjX (TVP38/TMEM64 family)